MAAGAPLRPGISVVVPALNEAANLAAAVARCQSAARRHFPDHEVIVVDDAHASENYIADLWTVRIRRFEEKDETLFKAVAGVLKQVVSESNYARMTGESRSLDDVAWVDKIATPQLVLHA